MALRLSKGCRNSMLGNAFLMGTSLAYSDNGGSPDSITDSNNNFINAGFRVGDAFNTVNSTTAGNDETGVTLVSVAAGTITFATGTLSASEAFEADTYIVSDNGGSFQTVFADGVLEIYSGSQPATADAAESGTKLVRITLASGAFVGGVATNGLEFDPILSGIISKASDEVWSGVGLATGTAGWFRFYANDYDTGADETAVRFDGAVGTSGAQLNLSSVSIAAGATITIDSLAVTLPTS